MKGLFVTATGTDVGKTVVSCAVAALLKRRGVGVGVLKPFASGCSSKGGVLVSRDAVLLKRAAQCKDRLEDIAPVRFRDPLAPWSCLRIEGRKLNWNRAVSTARRALDRHAFTVVEGIGGARVPLDDGHEVSDLAKALDLPVLVVASAKLGTLNHTLLTLEHLRRKRLRVLGVVLNFFDPRQKADLSNLRYFKSKRIPVLAALPFRQGWAKNPGLAVSSLLRSPLSRLLPR